ncbi:MAG: hypothetical protein HQL96_06820 [Magnetococcales bacterium]|nr:hypothetical protein [Magnetococcales bacterium]
MPRACAAKPALALPAHPVTDLPMSDPEDLAPIVAQPAILDEILSRSHHKRRIRQAASLEELTDAVRLHPQWVQSLISKGVKIRYIGRVMLELDRQVFQQATRLLARPEWLEHLCVLVMGSEGRGEQVIKNDQDNALIIDEALPMSEVRAFCQALSAALSHMDYPACAGNVMLCNPQWAQSLDGWKKTLLTWIHDPTPTHLMWLAIAYDARVVAGRKRLFGELREFFWAHLPDDPAFYAHLARPALAFKTPLGLFKRFILAKGARAGEIDLKKGGIFPIVHGVRVLAMEQRLQDPNTVRRIRGLTRRGVLERQFGEDLVEVFDFLAALRARAGDHPAPARLMRLERESLRDCLHEVERFKRILTHHFRLRELQ